MLALKFILSMFFLVTLIPGRDGKTCLCEGFACTDTSICADDSYSCYSAVRRLEDGREEPEKGCAPAGDCASRRNCVTDDDKETCLKYGCCNTSLCVANFTYFYSTPSPSPTPTPAEIRASTPVQIPTSVPAQIPTSAPAPAPATTQISPVEKLSTPVVQASSTKKPAVAATSSVPEKMSSEPAMATSKAAKPMLSSQKQVEPSKSKEVMMSSEEKMKPTPSQVAGNTATFNSLIDPIGPTKMSSEPAMATSKAAKPMLSSQKQVEPSKSKEVMMSSEEKMKPTPSQVAGNTATFNSLIDPIGPTKMSSEPAMATSKAAKPMLSSQKQVEPSKSKEVMMSSEEKMKPTPSQVAGNTATVNSLIDAIGPTVDDRPTCPDSSERVYSLGIFALVAIAILCNVF